MDVDHAAWSPLRNRPKRVIPVPARHPIIRVDVLEGGGVIGDPEPSTSQKIFPVTRWIASYQRRLAGARLCRRPRGLGARRPRVDGVREHRRGAGAVRPLLRSPRDPRLRDLRLVEASLRRAELDGGDSLRGDGRAPGRRRLRQLRRSHRCARADGRRALRRVRPPAHGIHRALLRPPGSRWLHRRLGALHRGRSALQDLRRAEAFGQHRGEVLGRHHECRRLELDHHRRRADEPCHPLRAGKVRTQGAGSARRRRPRASLRLRRSTSRPTASRSSARYPPDTTSWRGRE